MEHANNIADGDTAFSLSHTELTLREVQILNCLALGGTDKQIANHFQISVKTVNHHVNHILVKLKATNRTHAVAKAIMSQLVQPTVTDVVIGKRVSPTIRTPEIDHFNVQIVCQTEMK